MGADCPSDGHCLGQVCVQPKACANSRDCGTDEVCDPGLGVCVECAAAADCADGRICVLNRCVTPATCESSDDCDGKPCDTERKLCVDCLSDEDCAADTERCASYLCRPACTSDKQCTPQGLLCDTEKSACVECKAHADCPATMYCEVGTCKPDLCDDRMSTCTSGGVAACNEHGSGWLAPQSCGSEGCKASGMSASCGGNPDADGGPPDADGGVPEDDGGTSDAPIGCTTATATPCTTLPRFGGSQAVDGADDDLCSIPSFEFSVNSAQVNHNYNSVPNEQFEVVTARVGWSPDALHVFLDVKDASIQTVDMKDPGQAVGKAYQGDSVELFFTSSEAVTGLTGSDGNALHVTIPANGPAVVVKTSSGGGTTHTELPAEQYKQTETSGGWAVELRLPWPGGAPSGGGKIRFDMALNSADTNCGGVDDMRDAQLVYHLDAVTQTTCPGETDAWCDDRAWCSTSLGE